MPKPDTRERDPRVCWACGEPVDGNGDCSAMRTIKEGVTKLAEMAGRGD